MGKIKAKIEIQNFEILLTNRKKLWITSSYDVII